MNEWNFGLTRVAVEGEEDCFDIWFTKDRTHRFRAAFCLTSTESELAGSLRTLADMLDGKIDEAGFPIR